MLRDQIAPALRERGFKGSGSSYVLPDETHWLQLGFQASRWSSASGVEFTVNVAVAEKAAWDRLAAERGYSGRPSPVTRYSADTAVWRLGSLAFGEDRWWRVPDRPEDAALVAAAVLEALDRAGLPRLRARGAAG
jgi:hypothetical protein